MGVIKHKTWFFIFSGLTVALALFAIFFWGLKPSIDFTGGSLIEIAYPSDSSFKPDVAWIEQRLEKADAGVARVQPSGEHGFIIRTGLMQEDEQRWILENLSEGSVVPQVVRSTSIGPTIGTELRRKALWSVLLIVAAIIAFIAIVFRKVSEPVASWKYGVIAIITLLHDVIVPMGVFAFLGRFGGFEVDTLFVTALLAILGLSVNDTIVVFDRIRENLAANKGKSSEPFEEIVGKSLSETYLRSFNTSFMVIVVLLALYLFGGSSTRDFALVLAIGMIAGTYSSIILASPLLVVANNIKRKG
jgi:preprotein translocase subunit SecF